MKNLLILALLFLSVGLFSCGGSDKDRTQYDIYRVEVRTHLNIRDSPSKNGELLGYIYNGGFVKVIEISDGWAKIRLDNGKTGYVSSDYLVLERQYSRAQSPDSVERKDTVSNRIAATSDAGIADAKGYNTRENATSDSTAKSGPNVHFIGDSAILNDAERWMITEKLKGAGEYVFVVNTVESVPTKKIFDYAPDLLDDLSEEMDSSMSWWQRFKSWFGGDCPSANVVLLSYIKNSTLLQAECNGTSLKYLKMSQPKEYFKLQFDACANPASAIAQMGIAISKAGKEYEGRSIFIRGQINSGNIFENICEDWIVENILPRDSFWHKYVLGWIFAAPLKLADWLFALTGSYLWTLIILMVIILGLDFLGKNAAFKNSRLGMDNVGCLTKGIPLISLIVNFILWLSMLSLLIYMIPDMTTLAVMAESGYPKGAIMTAMHSFATYAVTKNWFLVTMFFVGLYLTIGLNSDYALNATLPSSIQRRLYAQNRETIKNSHIIAGQEFDADKIDKSDTPFLELFTDSMGKEDIGKTLGVAIPLSFVFNGAFLLFASLFYWTKVLRRLIKIGIGVASYRKLGLYR